MTHDNEPKKTRTVVIVGSISGSFSRLAALLPILIAEQERKGVEIIISEPEPMPVPEYPVIRLAKADTPKTHPVRPTKFQNPRPHQSGGIKPWKRFRR